MNNSDLFIIINKFAGRSSLLDRSMIFVASYLIFIIPLFLVFLWFKRSKDNENKRTALFIFISVVFSVIIGWGISLFYFHPRPFMIGMGKELIRHSSETSFPSDHATAMFALSFSLLFLKKYLKGVIFFMFSFLVGFARVFCGIHFPFDIVGSFFVAFVGTGIIFISREKLDILFERIIEIYLNIEREWLK